MKAGDVVSLKEGTFGLKGADTLAIYLERVKRKGNFFIVVQTGKGRKEVKPDNVKALALKARVDDPLAMSEADLLARLKDLRAELGKDPGKRGSSQDARGDELDDRRVWELVVEKVAESVTAEEAAGLAFGTAASQHLSEVRAALQACQTQGVGYFERAPGRGERYRPHSVDEVKAIRREIEGVRALRNKLVHVVEVEDPETGELRTVFEPVPVADAGLTADDRARLDLLSRYMQDFVLHDRDRGEVGLAGTRTHTLDGFSLFRFARFLAFDWLGNTSASVSGAFVRFLLEAGLANVREANLLVARRHVLLSQHMAWDYPEPPLREAGRLPNEIPPGWRAGRRDLTALETYTIDPADAKDRDDAISLAREGPDTLLYVHIADVAQYVEAGSIIDREARKRGTSTYLPTGVLPMLPPRLSDDLCSLNDGGERPALTALLRVGPDGRIRSQELFESVIRVTKNLAYPQVDAWIVEGREPFRSLHELAGRMRTHRQSLSLETDELKIHIEHDSVDPHLKSGSDATRLIEQFMVAANEAVAVRLTEEGVAAPYRCHPLPDRASVETFNRRMEVLELAFRIELPERAPDEAPAETGEAAADQFLEALKGGKLTLVGGGFLSEPEDDDGQNAETAESAETAEDSALPTSGAPKLKGLAQLTPPERTAWLAPFQRILEEIARADDKELRDLVQFKLLACMGRALYTPENLGHFGLGSPCYLHFTSPIRRYPDLATHRQLKWLLRGRDGPMPHSPQELASLCPLNTDQSVEAEKLERKLVSVALAFEARTPKWEGTHRATVNGITKGGVFLSLPRGVEARLATSDIPGGPWSVDEADAMLFKGSLDDPTLGVSEAETGEWRALYNAEMEEMVRVRLRLGDKFSVRIVDYDLVEGQIKCRLAPTGA